MSSYSTQNHTDQGGEVTTINGTLNIRGTLNILDGATVTGLPSSGAEAVLTGLEDVDEASLDSIRNTLAVLISKLTAAGVEISV